ncbi:MAG: radical SAM protein [Candidatus Cloacimonadota bacterium]|nr:MAG: radical SAM protein [Candidatus Cloacimonadota bacterium]PIE79314.1 MAG: radical SAM protein [Candidatus Delongbacteria bacterium]
MRYLFGPVPSRRMGSSLGIDLLDRKICNFNCIYCEVAKTEIKTIKRDTYVPVKDVLDEIKEYLVSNFKEKPDFITFSGSGEPTLHSELGTIIDEIKKITDIPVAVITNSGTITDPSVFNDLLKADLVMPSLDAISKDIILKINKVNKEFCVEKTIEELSRFSKEFKGEMWLEILALKDVNDSDEEFKLLKEAVDKINPTIVQVHTVSRPSMAGKVTKVDEKRLKELSEIIGEKAMVVKKFSSFPNKRSNITTSKLLESLLKVRACSFNEILSATGASKKDLELLIEKGIKERRLLDFDFDGIKHFKLMS